MPNGLAFVQSAVYMRRSVTGFAIFYTQSESHSKRVAQHEGVPPWVFLERAFGMPQGQDASSDAQGILAAENRGQSRPRPKGQAAPAADGLAGFCGLGVPNREFAHPSAPGRNHTIGAMNQD